MSLRLIITFAFFALLTLYFTFLNPGDVELHFTQNTSFSLPIAVFLLISVLAGILLTTIFTSYSQIKSGFKHFLETRSLVNKSRLQKKWEEQYQIAENALKGGHRDRALSLFKKILNGNPDHVASLIAVGNLHRKMGKTLKLSRRTRERPKQAVTIPRHSSNWQKITPLPDNWTKRLKH